MHQVTNRSKRRTLAMYLGMTVLLGFTAVTTDVALGFLTNAQMYLRVQAPGRAETAAVAGHTRAYALSDTRGLGSSGSR